MAQERGKIQKEGEKEKRRRDQEEVRIKDELKALEREVKTMSEGLKQGLKDMEARLSARGISGTQARVEGNGGEAEQQQQQQQQQQQRRPCIVLTDSNGQDATEESIKSHMPQEDRAKCDIQVVVAFRLEDAYERIWNCDINVKDANVIIDNYTNNVRGGKGHAPEPPEVVTQKVALLRELILARSARAVVVCELKPMRWIDVRPYTTEIHSYLDSCGDDGHGCRTQIRMNFLKSDGVHVKPEYETVVDRTYACAFRGVHVPDPTPFDDLTPESHRRRWEKGWPRLGGKGKPHT